MAQTRSSDTPKKKFRIPSEAYRAAIEGDLQKMRKLRFQGSFPDMLMQADDFGVLPLDAAAARGHFECVEIMVYIHKFDHYEDYQLKNKNNYSPILSSVHWYCRVLDGSYDLNGKFGNFNVGPNRDKGYIATIKLLLQSYPEYLYTPDKNNEFALHHAIYSLSKAKKNNPQIIPQLTNLISVLMDKMSLDYQCIGGITPRNKAKLLGVEDIINKIEISKDKEAGINTQPINLTKSSINSAIEPSFASQQKPISATVIEAKKEVTSHKKNNVATKNESNKEMVEPKSEPNKEIVEKSSEKNKVKEQELKHRKKPSNDSSYNLLLEENDNDQDNQMLSKASYVKQNKLTESILAEFKNNIQGQQLSPAQINLFTQQLSTDIATLLKNFSNAKQEKLSMDKKDLQTFAKNLASAIKLNSETTGFLCWKRTRHWVTLNQQEFNDKLDTQFNKTKLIKKA